MRANPVAKIFGINPILEQLDANPEVLHHLYLPRGPLRGQLGRVARVARERKVSVTFVEKRALDRLAGGGAHQGVVAETGEYRYRELSDILDNLSSPARLLVLDGVQDPQNLGAIVRTAVCTGIDGIVIPKRNAAAMTSAAIKASAGGAARARIARVSNLVQALDRLKVMGLWCVAIEANGERDIRELDKMTGYALIFGAEGKGIRRLVRERCDLSARIPMPGPLDSLNVSVAVGVALFSMMPR